MTTTSSPKQTGLDQDHWKLQDAKAHFSEVVRRAAAQGPQHVTVNGREKAVIISTEEYLRLKGGATGQELVELLADSPLGDVAMEHSKTQGSVRDVEL